MSHTETVGAPLPDNDEENYLENVLAWCRAQEFWAVVQPVVAAGYAVDLHVPELPLDLVPPERRTMGVLAVCIKVVRPLPGVLVIRPCERTHFQASRLNATDSLDLIVAEMLLDDDEEDGPPLDGKVDPSAINSDWD
jgi:hypothetical protein